MGERALGRQTAFDQPVWRIRLNDTCIATTAGIARANGDDDLEAGRNDVEPFGAVFADLHNIGAAAGTDASRGFDHLLDARQVIWQMAKVAFGCWTSGPAISIALCQRCPGSLDFRDGRFQILESQLTLIGRQLLGPLAISAWRSSAMR
jgi:hypothetical protein